jgi:phenylacetate-CoA ligase
MRKQLEESQWWSREKLAELQLERLRVFLNRIAANVPYYRSLFHELAFVPAEVTSLRDLARLPFLSKSLIRQYSDPMRSEQARHLARYNTGGSSGEPLIFFIGKDRVSHDVAAKWRATRWWGVDIGDPEIVVWGSPIELRGQDRVKAIRDRVLRSTLVPAFEMSPVKLDFYVQEILRIKPRMLFGYPSALAYIAKHAQATGQSLAHLGVKVAFVTSERLYDEQREQIARTFGCPVANGYGGRDAGFIAHECPSGGMHVTAEDVIVEIVDRDGNVLPPGQAGEIVVTHLATHDFPFVRYRTGDVGVLDEQLCACGRGLPLLKEIQGRTTDFVMASDGTVMHGLALIYVVRDLPGVRAFKIVQESLATTRVLLVADADFSESSVSTIVAGFRRRLGQDVDVVVERVQDIPPERSGKHRYVMSRLF